MDSAFGAKLSLLLKALSMNRARLAADLAVDKSLVGRWVSGAVTPSAHNLHRLTELIASRKPGFTLLHWERPLDTLAAELGVTDAPSGGVRGGFGQWMPQATLEEIETTTRQRGYAYEGFWRSTRAAPELPGRFLHDHSMMRVDENGMLIQTVSLSGYVLRGWAMPLRNQLFSTLVMEESGMVVFSVFNGIPRQKAEVIDGITLSCLPDAGGSPVAGLCIMERIGELSRDVAADDAHFESLRHLPPVAPEGSVPPHVRDHLYRDMGPSAVAAGGDAVMLLHFGRSLARGVAFGGQPGAPASPPTTIPPSGSAEVIRPAFGRPAG